jgi:hypothetical protein
MIPGRKPGWEKAMKKAEELDPSPGEPDGK